MVGAALSSHNVLSLRADLFCLVTTVGGLAGVVIRRDLMPRLVALGLSAVLDIHDGGRKNQMNKSPYEEALASEW